MAYTEAVLNTPRHRYPPRHPRHPLPRASIHRQQVPEEQQMSMVSFRFAEFSFKYVDVKDVAQV